MMASNDIPVWIDSAKAMLQARKAGDRKWYEVRRWQKRPLMHEVSNWMIAGVFLSAVGLFFSVPGSLMLSFPMVHHVEDLPFHKVEGGINAAFKPAEYSLWALMLLIVLFRYTSLKFIFRVS
jgi:hypothetical protein